MPAATLNSRPTRAGIAGADYPLDTLVREVMTPGVVAIADDAAIGHASRAMARHGVHGVLVLGCSGRDSVGWITAEGITSFIADGHTLVHARDAVSQEVIRVDPSSTVREAALELSRPGISHLLVAHPYSNAPEGVLTHSDMAAFVGS